jgi:hypothetical protein
VPTISIFAISNSELMALDISAATNFLSKVFGPVNNFSYNKKNAYMS